MTPTLEMIGTYFARVAPGLALGAAMLYIARRNPQLRIVLYLSLFTLLRDAMTPLDLWAFGPQGLFWIRFYHDPWFLMAFGIACLGLTLGMYFLDRENRALVRWTRGNVAVGLLFGLCGAIAVVAPLALLYRQTPIESRGGAVLAQNLPALLVLALLGNLLEELLFRGYVCGWLARTMPTTKAGIGSGIIFAFCHMFLATTVTSVGHPLLAFTLWEGVIAGIVWAKSGIIPSTLTHGGAIFLLASGLL